MKNVYLLRLGIVCILLTSTIPASASNYSSPGEALRLSNLKVTSAKTCIFSVNFRPRLAVSKWIVPRPFLIGGVLGYPTSFLVDTWQAKDDIDLPFLALYTWQAKDKKSPNRSCRCSKCTIGTFQRERKGQLLPPPFLTPSSAAP